MGYDAKMYIDSQYTFTKQSIYIDKMYIDSQYTFSVWIIDLEIRRQTDTQKDC